MVGFADRVRIKGTELTEKHGVAEREGIVHGYTTPSVTGVTVIGEMTDDYAVNVYFDELNEGFWFAEELVEFVGHVEGAVVSLDGMDVEFVQLPNGEWEQRPKTQLH
jgi:hypothetical protein